MSSLRVDLQAGFNGDRVHVQVDGRDVYDRADVRTDYSVGLADSFATAADAGGTLVTLQLPDRGLSASVRVPSDQPYVGFTVELDGRITYQLSPEAFRYY